VPSPFTNPAAATAVTQTDRVVAHSAGPIAAPTIYARRAIVTDSSPFRHPQRRARGRRRVMCAPIPKSIAEWKF
jgi:hypothetical protein